METTEDSTLPGPYPLLWLSDAKAPCAEEVGIGIGCLKVRGNTQSGVPIRPATQVLPPEEDPIREEWIPHGSSPVEPGFDPLDGLSLIERNWRPHRIESAYRLDGARVRQETAVFEYGCQARIDAGKLDAFDLRGESVGPCKVWLDGDGLHVIETGAPVRPLGYTIALDPRPDATTVRTASGEVLDGAAISALTAFDRGIEWTFAWDSLDTDLRLDVIVSRDGTAGEDESIPSIEATLANQNERWTEFYRDSVPVFKTPDERINRLGRYFAYVSRSNRLNLGGLLPHTLSMPKQTFSGFWMWDACYHAIAACWLDDRDAVWSNLRNVENVQYPPNTDAGGVVTNRAQPYGVDVFESDDALADRTLRMPHTIAREVPDHGDGTHPPVVGQALRALGSVDGNTHDLRRLLPNALAYHDWFETRRASERFPDLLLVRRWSDSGMDNSKRWGAEGSGIYGTDIDTEDWSMPVVTVDLNVLSVLEKRALADCCEAVDRTDRARTLRETANARADAIRSRFWNDDVGFYLDREESSGEFVPVLSPTGFYPLLLEDSDPDRVDHLLAHLFDDSEFWAPAPLPSLSMDDPDFRPEHSYWMGCTWMNYTVYTLRGLFRTDPEAGWRLLDRVLDTLMREGSPYIFENYNPETGVGYDAANFGWHGMLVDVILREALGIDPTGGELTVSESHCPDSWDSWTVEGLPYRGGTRDVTVREGDEAWRSVPRPE